VDEEQNATKENCREEETECTASMLVVDVVDVLLSLLGWA
jgi:hypothetical protein|tara:strand:+ start:151 stop:270 length:120 start_codon:yes stop_codon:yes gene_type:complete